MMMGPLKAASLSFLSQVAALVGTGNSGNSRQGFKSDISDDGNTLVVAGSPDTSNFGAVWVFIRSALGAWSQQGLKLTPSDTTGTTVLFGAGVAVSADGNTLAAGGSGNDTNKGAAWVFTRTAGVWTQQGLKITPSDPGGTTPRFGASVSLSADGNTLAVGAITDTPNSGAAWVFTRTAGVWTQQGLKLTESGGSNHASIVSLSDDGNTLVMSGTTVFTVFTRTAGVWSLQQSLSVTGAVGGTPGSAVAISGDGNTLLAGSPTDNSTIGAVWVFTRSAGVWTQYGSKILAADETGAGGVGNSMSMNGDGTLFAACGAADNSSAGAVFVFKLIQGVWTQSQSKLTPGGTSVTMTPNGGTIAVGNAPVGSVGSIYAYVYD